MSRFLLLSANLFLLIACNSSSSTKGEKDSAEQSENTPGEQNYTMENNVNYEKKPVDPNLDKARTMDSVRAVGDYSTMTADTTAWYPTDTTSKK